MADEITTGEIYRLLLAQSSDLLDIKRDVRGINDSMARHETRISLLEERTPAHGGRQGALAGGAVAGVFGLVEIARRLFA